MFRKALKNLLILTLLSLGLVSAAVYAQSSDETEPLRFQVAEDGNRFQV